MSTSLQWRHNVRDGASFTSLTIVYSTVYSGADQRKHQSSAWLAFVLGIHRWPVNSPHKVPVTWKMFSFDEVIMWWLSIRLLQWYPLTAATLTFDESLIMLSQGTWNKCCLHSYMSNTNKTFSDKTATCIKRLPSVHSQVYQERQTIEILKCKVFPRSPSSEMQPVTRQNGYRSVPRWFARFCMIWMIRTPQTLCKLRMTPTCHMCISKLHDYKNILWIRRLFRHGQSLLADTEVTSHGTDSLFQWRRGRVTWITWSNSWRSLICRIQKSLLSQNNAVFITTTSIV